MLGLPAVASLGKLFRVLSGRFSAHEGLKTRFAVTPGRKRRRRFALPAQSMTLRMVAAPVAMVAIVLVDLL